jgi:hypothetical protein
MQTALQHEDIVATKVCALGATFERLWKFFDCTDPTLRYIVCDTHYHFVRQTILVTLPRFTTFVLAAHRAHAPTAFAPTAFAP